MKWSSGFERPQLRRRMVTKNQKFSMYRTTENEIQYVVESEKEKNLKDTEENC